jgi:hypothetical protein
VLSSEVPAADVGLDSLGLTIARLVMVCDLLLDDSVRWLWPGAKAPPSDPEQGTGHAAVLDRYADELAELTFPAADALDSD